jgi:hypothetical protein
MTDRLPFILEPAALVGGVEVQDGTAPIYGAVWYLAPDVDTGLVYRFAPGALVGAHYLTADFLCPGSEVIAFRLELQEGEDGPVFQYFFAVLPDASARLRMPMEAVNQNRWMFRREGALLKPRVGGLRVNLERVDRMRIMVHRVGSEPPHWCMTPVLATNDAPLLLDQPVLPEGALLDELGQNNLRDWPEKTHTVQAMIHHLHAQLETADAHAWPEGFSKWGGWEARRFEATGFFRTQWDDEIGRWWLVDPDGCVFWSAGQDCVRVDTEANYTNMENALSWMPDPDDPLHVILGERGGIKEANYLQANFMRAFGPDDWYRRWAQITLGELRRAGLNTVGNWSDWHIAREAGFPYVRPMDDRVQALTVRVYRELPDVFDPAFEAEAEVFASQLEETRDDPALIGYFMMNEPTWGFAQETPAEGMLYNTPVCASRRALADFLRERYGDDDGLSEAWGFLLSIEEVAEGTWYYSLTPAARTDLAEFSALMVERYFSTLSAACKAVDPHHLNLGVRYHTLPPAWAAAGMHDFDVFSLNCYRDRVPAEELERIYTLLHMPVLVGEWHMGALDVGLPATGVGPRVRDQQARAQAYRFYLENAAAIPYCVGVHHFNHYDQSALGRFDGEAYNIGFYDICNRPYEALVQAARLSHERMYPVALGEAAPFADAPEYLPAFFY